MVLIVSIGGGALHKPKNDPQTRLIDERIVGLTKKKRPKALFIPTASEDAPRYCERFEDAYKSLGCKVEHLLLYRDRPSKKRTRELILGADLIYVGGGNTLRMMKLWRKLGVDKHLIRAAKDGCVMAGLSAGAICWFEKGNSDSKKYSSQSSQLIRVKGLGLAPGIVCPHYDKEKNRRPSVHGMVERYGDPIIALDNCSAIIIRDDWYETITTRTRPQVRLVEKERGLVVERVLQDGLVQELTSTS